MAASSANAQALEFLGVLAAYRRQSEATGHYDEAQRAHQKLQEIMRSEEEVSLNRNIW